MAADAAARIPGGGAMGERVRALDWSATPLGRIRDWPDHLCSAVSQLLASPVSGALLWGREAIVVACNDAYRPLLGGKPEALGRPFLEVWPELREAGEVGIGRALAGETVSASGARFLLQRGRGPEEAWFDYGFSPLRDGAGRILGVVLTCIEITDRRRAEADRVESEARWRAVFDNMGEGCEIAAILPGPDGRPADVRYLEVNAAWERHSGVPRSMILGRRATEVFPPREAAFWVPLLGGVAETGEPAHLERYFAPAARWLEVIAYRLGPDKVAILIRNITERREAAERQRAALETGLIGFFEWDVAAGTISGDERLARFYGIDPAAAAAGLPRSTLTGLIHRDDIATVEANVSTALDRCAEVANEFRVVRADGTVRWLLVRSRCTGREGDRALRYTGTAVDVTESRAAEAALRDSEAWLRVALEAAGLGAYEWDLRADSIRYSERTGELFGFGPGEGLRPADYLARCVPEDRVRMWAEIEDGVAAGQLRSRYRIRLPDGTLRHIGGHGRVLRDAEGAPGRVVGVLVDETERVRAEDALRESESRLQLALDASGMVGLFDWHVPADRVIADARFARLFAMEPERLSAGVPIAELTRRIHPDDRRRVQDAICRAMDTGEPYEAEYRIVQDQGDEHWVAARGRCLRDPAGLPQRFSGTVVDVTARRRAEERQTLLSREVDHRAKNALAVVQAALRLTRSADLPGYIRLIEGRVAALARAQTLLAEDRWAGADLLTLLRGELHGVAGTESGPGQRAMLHGPKVALPPGAAQPLAMAIHELATNAVKYGALSTPGGRVAVSWALDGGAAGRLRLRWAEEGGPPVEGPPARRGFGTRVLDATVRGQLGGAVALGWEASGLVCELEIPLLRTPAMEAAGITAD